MRQTSALSCFEQDLDHFVNHLRSSYHFGPINVVHETSKEKKLQRGQSSFMISLTSLHEGVGQRQSPRHREQGNDGWK